MTRGTLTFRNGQVFDGVRLHQGDAVRFENGVLMEIGPDNGTGLAIDLDGDILSPGYVDLQVNGGGGIMFNHDPSVETLRQMAEAHRSLGVTVLLPTLITDTPDITHAAIAATIEAVSAKVPGIAGLHLEGPHLSVRRKGAHDADLIRPMMDSDLTVLLEAVKHLPCLKVTLAPESVSEAQVSQLAQAGILVSLGHSEADFDTCQRYFQAGARCVTHLFNAMSQIGNREPGLAGAAIATETVSAGLIADGVHVHPEVMAIALQAKRAPGQIYLVSDAMAVAGTEVTSFELNGRTINRRDGQLRLTDGTLAGADLNLTQAISTLVHGVGWPLEEALASATSVPAELCGRTQHGLRQGVALSDVIRIRSDLSGLQSLIPVKEHTTSSARTQP